MRSIVKGFSDGACKGNPGRGGWGAVVIYENGSTIEAWSKYGGKSHTTNQEMELTAFQNLLTFLPKNQDLVLYTDSKYVLGGLVKNQVKDEIRSGPGKRAVFSGWVVGWQKNGWKKADGKIPLHLDLWKSIISECERHISSGSTLKLEWVKGHSGVYGNEYADYLANLGVPRG